MSAPTEQHVTQVSTADFPLPTGGVLAQLTLGTDSNRPLTLGPAGMKNLRKALSDATERSRRGEIQALAVTGTAPYFLAGADLRVMGEITSREQALELGSLGHEVFSLLADLPIPTFAFISGAALGGGLELALHADYRVIVDAAAPVALPEVALGIVPGWGGCWQLPRLIGVENALEVIVSNPLRNNRQLRPDRALEMGIVDAVLAAADFPERAREWAGRVLAGEITITRAEEGLEPNWQRLVERARDAVDSQLHGAAPAPYRALELLAAAQQSTRAEGYAAENTALGDLLLTDEFRASLYAFNLVNRARSARKSPQGEPARLPLRAGVVGAGLMATQLARVIAENLEIDVVIRDLDSERIAAGLGALQSDLQRDVAAGRLDAARAQEIQARVHGTTRLEDYSDCQLVIEAVTEKLDVKRAVFRELETVLSSDAILATNTSALSVEQMARGLNNPERVIGLHFFNPVARMPLVEIVRAPQTSDATVAGAHALVQGLRKSGVVVADAPGFVVNRLLLRFLAELFSAADQGVPLQTVEEAVQPLGLPMSPLALLNLVGPAVANYVLTALHEGLGPRYRLSAGLERIASENLPVLNESGGPAPETTAAFTAPDSDRAAATSGSEAAAEVLARVQDALGDEVSHMLADGVVEGREDIDLCMILGAGWPLFLGGLTPYLERVGALPDSAAS